MHNIKQNDKLVGTFLFWHGLNEIVEKITSANNPLCIGTNPTGWDVCEKPMTIDAAGKTIATPFHILTGSDNGETIGLPFNKKSYAYVTNANFVKCVQDSLASVAGLDYRIESAGSVRNRGRVFMAVKIGTEAENTFIVDGRKFQSHLNFINSHDKSCPFTVVDTSTCTVCDNTLSMNLNSDGGAMNVRLIHRKGIISAIKDVPRLVEAAITGRKNFARHLQSFAQLPVTATEAEQIFAAFIGKANPETVLATRSVNIIKRLSELFARGKGNKGESMLDVFQAVTEYYTHENAGDSDNKFKQFESSEFGTGADSKSLFFATLCDLSQHKDKFNGFARIGEKVLVAYRTKPETKAGTKA